MELPGHLVQRLSVVLTDDVAHLALASPRKQILIEHSTLALRSVANDNSVNVGVIIVSLIEPLIIWAVIPGGRTKHEQKRRYGSAFFDYPVVTTYRVQARDSRNIHRARERHHSVVERLDG